MIHLLYSILPIILLLLPAGFIKPFDSTPSAFEPFATPEMVYVEGGTFVMGCTDEQNECGNAEYPVHEVTVSSFYLGKYEVTQVLYEAVMGENPSDFKDCPNCPVESVSWSEAVAFARQLSAMTGQRYRLPTEAEWEYAARGGSKTQAFRYSGGDSLALVGWYENNSDSKTHPVGGKGANELGIYDMSGNVWEWCIDWNDGDYYENSPATNPQGPEQGKNRVLRGGCWSWPEKHSRITRRSGSGPDSRGNQIGFRVVLNSP